MHWYFPPMHIMYYIIYENRKNEVLEQKFSWDKKFARIYKNIESSWKVSANIILYEVLKLAKEFPLQDPAGINENSNGNALYYICEVFKNGLDS